MDEIVPVISGIPPLGLAKTASYRKQRSRVFDRNERW